MALLGLQEHSAEMGKVLQVLVQRGLDSTSLRLVQLLRLYPLTDPAPLLAFISLSIHLAPAVQMDAFLSGVVDKVSAADTKQAYDRIFLALQLVQTSADLEVAGKLLTLLEPTHALFKTACALVDAFAGFHTKTLDWLGCVPRVQADFLEWLLSLVSKDNAELAGLLLSELSKLGFQDDVEQVLRKLQGQLPLDKLLGLAFQHAKNAEVLKPLSNFTSACVSLLDRAENPVDLADKVSALLKTGQIEVLTEYCECLKALINRGSAEAVAFVRGAVEERQLLQELTRVLNLPNRAVRLPAWWLSARRRLPQDSRITTFCLHVLKKDDLPPLLEKAAVVFAQKTCSCGTALKLTEIYGAEERTIWRRSSRE